MCGEVFQTYCSVMLSSMLFVAVMRQRIALSLEHRATASSLNSCEVSETCDSFCLQR